MNDKMVFFVKASNKGKNITEAINYFAHGEAWTQDNEFDVALHETGSQNCILYIEDKEYEALKEYANVYVYATNEGRILFGEYMFQKKFQIETPIAFINDKTSEKMVYVPVSKVTPGGWYKGNAWKPGDNEPNEVLMPDEEFQKFWDFLN